MGALVVSPGFIDIEHCLAATAGFSYTTFIMCLDICGVLGHFPDILINMMQ